MTALNTRHFLVVLAHQQQEGVYQVITTLIDADLLGGKMPAERLAEVNYFLDPIAAEEYKQQRETCRFYTVDIVHWSAQAVQDAFTHV